MAAGALGRAKNCGRDDPLKCLYIYIFLRIFPFDYSDKCRCILFIFLASEKIGRVLIFMHEAKSHWINWLASGIPPTKLHSQSDISIAQSCAVSKSEMSMAGHWTIKLGIQTSGRNKSFQSLVFVLTQLHFGQLVEQSSILDTKFDCPVIRQNSLLFRGFFCFIFIFLFVCFCDK